MGNDFWGFDPKPDEPPSFPRFKASNTRDRESIGESSCFRTGDTKSVVKPVKLSAYSMSSVRNPQDINSQEAYWRKGLKHERLQEDDKALLLSQLGQAKEVEDDLTGNFLGLRLGSGAS
jgi:hypothetical protein